jgi:hypothetical protein
VIVMTSNAEYERPARLGPNAVGFDAKGRLYCDPLDSNAVSRRDSGELFLSARTGKLYLAHPADAERATRLRRAAEVPNVAVVSSRAELETRLHAAEAQASATDVLLRQALESCNELTRQNSYLKDRRLWEGLFFRPDGRPTKLLRRILFHTNGEPRRVFRKRVLDAAAKPGAALHYWLTSPAYLALPRAERPPSRH